MPEIKFYDRPPVPVEMHKVKIVQKLNLLPAEERLQKMTEAGFNSFQLHNIDIFMDMLTDFEIYNAAAEITALLNNPDAEYAKVLWLEDMTSVMPICESQTINLK